MTTKDIIIKFRVDCPWADGTIHRYRRWINVGAAPSTHEAVERWLDWCRKAYPGGTVQYGKGFRGNIKYVDPPVTVHFKEICQPLGCLENYEEVPR